MSSEPHHGGDIRAEDAAALEALFSGEAPRGQAGDRVERARALLGLLEWAPRVDGADRRNLVDLTVARAVRAGRALGPGSAPEPELSTLDKDALDALNIAGHDLARVPSALAERASRAEAIAGLLRSAAPAGGNAAGGRDLVSAVMARVQAQEAARADRMRLAPSRGWGVAPLVARWRDLVSVAAVLLIATSVLWTIAGAVSHFGSRASCLSGLRSVASAMGGYANDYRDELPVATASLGGAARWWDVRRDAPVSNAANLYTLPRAGYARLSDLACAGNPSACRNGRCEPGAMDWSCLDEVSYSYQIMFGDHRPKWNAPGRHVVLTDRSPVVRRAVLGETINPDENSSNHGGSGQNLLFSDGSAQWAGSPVLPDGDNIWLPRPRVVEVTVVRTPEAVRIEGRELPRDENDAFVGP